VEFDDFLKIVLEHRSVEDAPKEILDAFRQYDTQRLGYVDAKQLKYILTNTGEKLTERDGKDKIRISLILVSFLVDLILRELNVGSDGRVYYDNLVHMMTQPLSAKR
jgi:Ca2+-binding EF-hand superfamily protein